MCHGRADQNTVRSQASVGNWLVGVGTSNWCVCGTHPQKKTVLCGPTFALQAWIPAGSPNIGEVEVNGTPATDRSRDPDGGAVHVFRAPFTHVRQRAIRSCKRHFKEVSKKFRVFFRHPGGAAAGAATLARRDRKEKCHTSVHLHVVSFRPHTISEDRSDPSTTCTTMRFQPCFHQAQLTFWSVSASQSQCHRASGVQPEGNLPAASMDAACAEGCCVVAPAQKLCCKSRRRSHLVAASLCYLAISHLSLCLSLSLPFSPHEEAHRSWHHHLS